MGNIFEKCRKVKHFELNNDTRNNLYYDNINEELDENRNNVNNLRNQLISLENNYSKLISELNSEIVNLKNDFNNEFAKKNNLNFIISKLENQNQILTNRIINLESNEQFYSVTESSTKL